MSDSPEHHQDKVITLADAKHASQQLRAAVSQLSKAALLPIKTRLKAIDTQQRAGGSSDDPQRATLLAEKRSLVAQGQAILRRARQQAADENPAAVQLLRCFAARQATEPHESNTS